jgi:hypothetical protein
VNSRARQESVDFHSLVEIFSRSLGEGEAAWLGRSMSGREAGKGRGWHEVG